MQMKTERFEMRMDRETLENVDTWRADQPNLPSRSEAVRRLIDAGLAESRKRAVKISDGEKLILIMLCDLYKHLEVDSEIDPEFVSKTIYGGHYWGLEWEYSGLFHGHVDRPRVVSEVVDLLNMWSSVESGYEQLSAKDKERVRSEAELSGENVLFPGFSGNDESEYFSIANFLINGLGRFGKFKGRDLNSHFPFIDDYRRMLTVFNSMRSTLIGRRLSALQIINLLEAQRHPEWKEGE